MQVNEEGSLVRSAIVKASARQITARRSNPFAL
jgi:hypothetical protein